MDVQAIENLPLDSVASNSPSGSSSSSPSLPNGELKLKIRLKPPTQPREEIPSIQNDENAQTSPPCICGSAQSWGFMIGCDICGLWLHGPCVSITEDQSKLIEEYHCPNCVAEHGPSKMKPRDQPKPDRKRKSQRNGTDSKLKLRLKTDFVELPDDDSKELKIAKHFLSMMKERIPIQSKTTTIREDNIVRTLTAQEFNVSFLAKEGVRYPLLVEDKQGLGIIVPPPPFSVDDVAALVGHSRVLDVMEVSTQAELTPQWTLGKWATYFRTPEARTKIYNVISLEFTGTKLNNFVRSPDLVREIDWTSNVWPKDSPVWPKVQYYCLMSVGCSYTDFHIDFGGSSVWYHVLEGLKIFFFIPPTEFNLNAYAQWSTSADQNLVFFADLVPDCYYAIVKPGQTLIVPTGWIHAVYTPVDSLVFGGNFLHSFNIGLQLKVYNIEERTKVQQKFRFPMFEQINWYAADYLRNYLKGDPSSRRTLSRWEYEGILTLVTVLDGWLTNSWRFENLPSTLTPDDAKQLVGELSQLILSENIEMETTADDEPWRRIIKENREKELAEEEATINNLVKETNGNVDSRSLNEIHEMKRSFEKLVAYFEQQQLKYRVQTSGVVTTRSRAKRLSSNEFVAELEGSEDEDYHENDRLSFVDDDEEEARSSSDEEEEDNEDEIESRYSRRSSRKEQDSEPLLTLDDLPKKKKKKIKKEEKVESPKIEPKSPVKVAQSPPTTAVPPPAAPLRPFEGLQPKKAQPPANKGVKKRLAKKLGMKLK